MCRNKLCKIFQYVYNFRKQNIRYLCIKIQTCQWNRRILEVNPYTYDQLLYDKKVKNVQ